MTDVSTVTAHRLAWGWDVRQPPLAAYRAACIRKLPRVLDHVDTRNDSETFENSPEFGAPGAAESNRRAHLGGEFFHRPPSTVNLLGQSTKSRTVGSRSSARSSDEPRPVSTVLGFCAPILGRPDPIFAGCRSTGLQLAKRVRELRPMGLRGAIWLTFVVQDDVKKAEE
jgi:hypothetical protein